MKYIFHISLILQIGSRILILEGFGLIAFLEDRFGPVWLILMVFTHCIFSFFIKMLVLACTSGISSRTTEDVKNYALSACLSAYTFARWEAPSHDSKTVPNNDPRNGYENIEKEMHGTKNFDPHPHDTLLLQPLFAETVHAQKADLESNSTLDSISLQEQKNQ